jgi:hypothetical protein
LNHFTVPLATSALPGCYRAIRAMKPRQSKKKAAELTRRLRH